MLHDRVRHNESQLKLQPWTAVWTCRDLVGSRQHGVAAKHKAISSKPNGG